MITEEDALARVLALVHPLPSRHVLLSDTLDCFAAQDVLARLSLPLFDNSAMDGYAVVASSCSPGSRLKIVGEQPAGVDRGLAVRPGEAVRIFTGAPIPAGADAVVMQEDVTTEKDGIVINEPLEAGEYIRRCGGDVAEGQKILSTGERISPQLMALLAAQGVESLAVGSEARVAIVSTGDELIAPGRPLESGQIYESNSVLLHALVRKCGGLVASVNHCRDHAAVIEAAIRDALTSDVLIISGGVSVGARDLVKLAIAAAGGAMDLWRVAVKPGKPFLFGRAGDCAIFGLPGNPVSAFVTFLLFVRPALLRMMGAADAALGLAENPASLTEEVYNPGDRPHYFRGILRRGNFTPVGRQESHALSGLSRSNALLRVAPRERVAAGTNVTVWRWD